MDMEKKIRFVTNSIEENIIRERISEYLQRSDYRLIDGEKMLYQRDTSKLGGMPAAFPKNLKVEIYIQTSQVSDQEVEVKATLFVDSLGRSLGKNERIFWESELEGIKSAVSAGSAYISHMSKNERMAAAASARSCQVAYLLIWSPLTLALLASAFLTHSPETKIIILVIGIFVSLIMGGLGGWRWLKGERTRRGKSENTYQKTT